MQLNLSPEQRDKLAGMPAEEIRTMAAQEGIELTDSQLEEVSGGWGPETVRCPKCGCERVNYVQTDPNMLAMVYECAGCGHQW